MNLFKRRLQDNMTDETGRKGYPVSDVRRTSGEKQLSQANVTVFVAVLSCVATCFAAYAAWRSSGAATDVSLLAHMQYENLRNAVQFAFELVEPSQDGSKRLSICQTSGSDYRLETINVTPLFLDSTGATVGAKTFKKSLYLAEGCEELTGLKTEYCDYINECDDREILMWNIAYRIYDEDRAIAVRWQ